MEDEIDWNNVFDDIQLPEGISEIGFDIFRDAPPYHEEFSTTKNTNENVESWIEELLMKDDDDEQQQQQLVGDATGNDYMWSDLLRDFPLDDHQPSDEGHVSDVSPSLSPPLSDDKNSTSCSNSDGNVNATANYDYGNSNQNNNDYVDVPNYESNGENGKSGDDVNEVDDTDDDPLSKKRKRQLKNRDAAMRSRERKKMYVKDLEMKSRYMEAECRRLGRLLQCCYAENQMLRISLGSAYGASMAKPESAVLLLESLLLVSLVWLMVNMCLLPLSRLPLLNQDAVLHGNVERRNLESAAPKGKGTKVTEIVAFSFMKSKRCSASRIKMKSNFDHCVLCA